MYLTVMNADKEKKSGISIWRKNAFVPLLFQKAMLNISSGSWKGILEISK